MIRNFSAVTGISVAAMTPRAIRWATNPALRRGKYLGTDIKHQPGIRRLT
jgi:hypothetical protein